MVRVRFAPSPTGGLHIGGVRTVLYNYLFARKHGGQFILRIEDTDQTRYVEGAEQYIQDCLAWCGLPPDESPLHGGHFAPYRQSERKARYADYGAQLIASGHAYYAFDTPEELEAMRERLRSPDNPTPQYDAQSRGAMRNSLTLPAEEVARLLEEGVAHVIRIRMPEGETISFTDAIRGEVSFHTDLVDDKVLLKADGMPTYHLAVVVDDYEMGITHAFRGEEWLPSAPVHPLLWRYLGIGDAMPQWAHLPLILGPDGAKLSKRHGSKYGFPIFAMNWTDPKSGELTEGFRERGFLPAALLNMLALLGWNDGSGEEIFSVEELVQRFDLSRVSHSGAVFDYEKALWFNHQHIQRLTDAEAVPMMRPYFEAAGYEGDDNFLQAIIGSIKERCSLLSDAPLHAGFYFKAPAAPSIDLLGGKWKPEQEAYFRALADMLPFVADVSEAALEAEAMRLMADHGLKKGDVLLPLRIMLVGEKSGPGVFRIAAILGSKEMASRILNALEHWNVPAS